MLFLEQLVEPAPEESPASAAPAPATSNAQPRSTAPAVADLPAPGVGDTQARAALKRDDELGDVGRAFDEMAERTSAVLQAQRRLMGDVSHELRTPLARIRVALELAAEDPIAAKDVLADVGGGKYFATTSYAELVAAIKSALSEIQSVNSAFASVSLPLTSSQQGQFLNQVFIGMFRPDTKFMPRWPGNLKQYKLGFLGTNRTDLKLLDASVDPQPAVNAETGFLQPCVRSFWTPGAADTYWSSGPSGDCLGYESSDSPDGNVVEKGAQGHMLRDANPATRVVKTCSAPETFGTCSLTDFATSTTAITAAMLNVSTAAERDALIAWARGANLGNELSKDPGAMRPSAHGDVIHSRPVAVNYGPNQVVVFYGGNDGMFRAINGNRTTTFNVSPGAELWSFMPPEFYGKLARLRQNTVPVTFPDSVPGLPKDYAIDGPISTFQGTVSGSPKAYVYATMRRGGRAIYAFDVTNPSSPSVLWKKGCPELWVSLLVPYTYVYNATGTRSRVVQLRAAGVISPTSLFFTDEGHLLVAPRCLEFAPNR
jgi:hypothetical protein